MRCESPGWLVRGKATLPLQYANVAAISEGHTLIKSCLHEMYCGGSSLFSCQWLKFGTVKFHVVWLAPLFYCSPAGTGMVPVEYWNSTSCLFFRFLLFHNCILVLWIWNSHSYFCFCCIISCGRGWLTIISIDMFCTGVEVLHFLLPRPDSSLHIYLCYLSEYPFFFSSQSTESCSEGSYSSTDYGTEMCTTATRTV